MADLSISQLKSKWYKEKESYSKKEVGSGVQKYVKDILKSEEILRLKEGLVSTLLQQRNNEFIEESETKAARRADIVIFIDQDIIIPLEVEKLGNIKAGLSQLLQYQLDLEKKYGILTDGQTWQFFNNAFILKEFQLKEILDDPDKFKIFWQEYIKPENYYISFFEERGQLKLLPEDLSVENRRKDFFQDVTTLIKSFRNKLDIEGYFSHLENVKERKKAATEITYAYIIQFILYKTLVDNSFEKFSEDFKDRENNIYELLKAEQYGKILGIIGGISEIISKNIYRPFKSEQDFIDKKLEELYHKPKNDLHDVSPWLDIFIFIKKYNFANVKNDIFGYIYENYLKELYQDVQKGQYFTDPAIVNFMLDQIGYTKEEIRKRLENKQEESSISIIDPSCGSGTFLYSATDRLIEAVPDGTERASEKIEELVNNNIFGLDIEEFPLYLAEMSIVMRMLPLIINEKYNNPIDKKIKVFKTRDSIAEFMDTALRNTLYDTSVAFDKSNGQMLLFSEKLNLGYISYVRDEDDLKEMKNSLENEKIPRRKFDYVIGNPPYIGYNECSKQKLLSFELMKKGRIKLSDIYGVNLHSQPGIPKKRPPKPNLYALFVALGLSLLKNNGKICYILPQTLLTSGDHDTLRFHLAKYSTIEKIIIFSGKLFLGRGLRQKTPVATSSMIFVLKKEKPRLFDEVEIINYLDSNDNIENCLKNILHKKKIKVTRIKQDDLLSNINSWNFLKKDKHFSNFYNQYKNESEDFSIYYNHNWANNKFGVNFFFDIGYRIDERHILKTQENGSYMYPKVDKKLSTIKLAKGYWPNIRSGNTKNKINLLQANQGYSLLDSKYKIIWSYANSDKFYFSDIPLIWARNQFCAIGSDSREEIIYLFSLLNSKINSIILEANLKNENEKDFLISTTAVKEFIRVPSITEDNQVIKKEIIGRTGEMLILENIKLSDLVDFSGVMTQIFKGVAISSGNLALMNEGQVLHCKIKESRPLVEKTIDKAFNEKKLFQDKNISLNELKNLPAVDFEKQAEINDYIDDLVFALYFNVSIEKAGLKYAGEIKKLCQQNRFYKIVDKS